MTSNNQTRLDLAFDADFGEILTNPIVDIAARFWDNDRYEAFKICYRSMRQIDDLVDHRKASGMPISRTEAERFRRMIFDWLEAVRRRDISDSFRREFIDVLEKFRIPFWPWERLYRSMAYDLEHDGYRSLLTFLRYAEGAAVAPASVFMHLSGISEEGGRYRPPDFDIRLTARPLALFCYLVHTIRDFRADQLNNLTCFAEDLLLRHGLSRDDLRKIAEGGAISDSFRDLIATYVSLAGYYHKRAGRMIDNVAPSLHPRYQLSLKIIHNLYLQVFEKFDPYHGDFTGPELNPSPEEVKSRIQQTIDGFAPVFR